MSCGDGALRKGREVPLASGSGAFRLAPNDADADTVLAQAIDMPHVPGEARRTRTPPGGRGVLCMVPCGDGALAQLAVIRHIHPERMEFYPVRCRDGGEAECGELQTIPHDRDLGPACIPLRQLSGSALFGKLQADYQDSRPKEIQICR